MAQKKIEEIDTSIRKHFRISQEYLILADYLSERIINNILPFFDKYNSTKKIVSQSNIFPYQISHLSINYNNHFLILFSEIKQRKINKSIQILDKLIEVGVLAENELEIKKWTEVKTLLKNKNWEATDNMLVENERRELTKLKIKPVANKT
ncbi:hypothetical protein ACU8V7_23550 [Zobellia nedashkovskayae]